MLILCDIIEVTFEYSHQRQLTSKDTLECNAAIAVFSPRVGRQPGDGSNRLHGKNRIVPRRVPIGQGNRVTRGRAGCPFKHVNATMFCKESCAKLAFPE